MGRALLLTLVAMTGAGTFAQTPSEAYRRAQHLDAEIQIQLNARPNARNPRINDYDYKLVSTPDNIVPADVVFSAHDEALITNQICFRGKPEDALELFKIMSDVMQLSPRTHVKGEVFADPTRGGKPWFEVIGIYEDGRSFVWFPRVRECDRVATKAEIEGTPQFLRP